ncbi:MAG: hypothetical protein QNK23_11290 [Crocinitomicaceae bacterium]|nr:hypothetical protein [Crocinitomicaceae bacterium]
MAQNGDWEYKEARNWKRLSDEEKKQDSERGLYFRPLQYDTVVLKVLYVELGEIPKNVQVGEDGLEILNLDPSSYMGPYPPHRIIGVTNAGDTLFVVDRFYKNKIKKGMTITLIPEDEGFSIFYFKKLDKRRNFDYWKWARFNAHFGYYGIIIEP